MNPHTALSIAQIIFYVPIAVLSIWLIVRNWSNRPRMAWWPMVPFSLMRVAGGPIVIALEKDQSNVGLIIAAIVLLNVGAVPLIVAMSGFFRIVLMDNFPPSKRIDQATRALRISILLAAILLTVGGSLISQPSQSTRDLGRILQLVGYAIFAAVIAFLIAAHIRFWSMKQSLIPTSRRVILGALASGPFLVVRCVYGILQVTFEFDRGTTWNPLYGSAVAFAMMALLVEYIAVIIYLSVGFSMPPDRGTTQLESKSDRSLQNV
ncbi:unnamed protein product [Clonostachys byssicola]|uniref:DUF7702 domain-containing protein n=1 Tax=Clonostachys byssicola TaxID=160290 RepID=A0A9N9U9Z2_9HYPO|nr:unnamed protein product [Clonostachys byssicola]